jgi:hypothetical protein
VSGPLGGLSFGKDHNDKDCDIVRSANEMFAIGSKLAGCKLMIGKKEFKAAGVTLEDCMGPAPIPIPVQLPNMHGEGTIPAPPTVTVTVPVTVVEPAPIPAPPQYRTEITVTAPKKKVVHHSKPECQNNMELRCVAKAK